MTARFTLTITVLFLCGPLRITSSGEPLYTPLELDALAGTRPEGLIADLGGGRYWHRHSFKTEFTRDGRFLVSAGHDGQIRTWELQSGRQTCSMPVGEILDFAISPSDELLAWTADALYIHDRRTGQSRRVPHSDTYWRTPVCFSADGSTILTLGWSLSLWNTRTGALVRKKKVETSGRRVLASSPTGGFCAVGGSDHNTISVHDSVSLENKTVLSLPERTGVGALCFSPDGKWLAAGLAKDGLVFVWSTDRWQLRTRIVLSRAFPEEILSVNSLAFFPDSPVLAISGRSCSFWNAATGQPVAGAAPIPTSFQCAISRDGSLLATSDKPIRVWRRTRPYSFQPLSVHRSSIGTIDWAPDSRRLLTQDAALSQDGAISVWRLHPPVNPVRLPTSAVLYPWLAGRHCVRFLPGEPRFIGEQNGVLTLFDELSGKAASSLFRIKGELANLAVSSDGKQVVTVEFEEDRSGVRALRVKTAPLHRPGSVATVAVVAEPEERFSASVATACSADGRVVAIADDTAFIRCFAVQGGLDFPAFEGEPGGMPVATSFPQVDDKPRTKGAILALSPDGKTVAWMRAKAVEHRKSDRDPTRELVLDLWEVRSGKRRARFAGDWDGASVIDFSPCGTRIALGTIRGQILVVSARDGRRLLQFAGHDGPVSALRFSPTGAILASGGEESSCRLWDLRSMLARRPGRASSVATDEIDRRKRTLWASLGDADAGAAYQAGWLTAVAPDAVVLALREHLKPVAVVPEARFVELIHQLGSSRQAERAHAEKALVTIGDQAIPHLERVLGLAPELEMRRRVERILAVLREEMLSPRALRCVRAVELLERMGTPPARRLLEELQAGASASQLAQLSADALTRLSLREPPR